MKSADTPRRRRKIQPVARLAVAALCAAIDATTAYAKEPFFTMNSQGELKRPVGYREWVYVGAPVTPDDLNGGKAPFPEFHAVYIDPASWVHWKKTGQFREGAVLIKELLNVGAKEAASGKGYFMGEYIGLEATIKSAKQFPKEPGNWAYFSFTNADHKTSNRRLLRSPPPSATLAIKATPPRTGCS
jgi:Cytochrome P460